MADAWKGGISLKDKSGTPCSILHLKISGSLQTSSLPMPSERSAGGSSPGMSDEDLPSRSVLGKVCLCQSL